MKYFKCSMLFDLPLWCVLVLIQITKWTASRILTQSVNILRLDAYKRAWRALHRECEPFSLRSTTLCVVLMLHHRNKKGTQGTPTIKQILPTANTTKGVRANFPVLLFTPLALQGIVCYTFVFRVVIGEVFTNVKVKLLCSEVCASHKWS